jgi:hypothetical protein
VTGTIVAGPIVAGATATGAVVAPLRFPGLVVVPGRWCAGAARIVRVLGLVARTAEILAGLGFVLALGGLGCPAAPLDLAAAIVLLEGRGQRWRNRIPGRSIRRAAEAGERPGECHACQENDTSDDGCKLRHFVTPFASWPCPYTFARGWFGVGKTASSGGQERVKTWQNAENAGRR